MHAWTAGPVMCNYWIIATPPPLPHHPTNLSKPTTKTDWQGWSNNQRNGVNYKQITSKEASNRYLIGQFTVNVTFFNCFSPFVCDPTNLLDILYSQLTRACLIICSMAQLTSTQQYKTMHVKLSYIKCTVESIIWLPIIIKNFFFKNKNARVLTKISCWTK